MNSLILMVHLVVSGQRKQALAKAYKKAGGGYR